VTCQEFVDFLMAYLDDELETDVRRVFEDHIGACPPCLAYLDTYRETVRLGKTVCGADDSLPDDVPDELVRSILAARTSGSRRG
jgi:anti-sigma factor RsiW